MKQAFSTGIDLVEISRFKKFGKDDRLTLNTFTKKELLECFKRGNPVASMAARFAAKEAVVKCIGNVRYNKIEITNRYNGKPEVKLLDRAISKQYNLAISLSHTEQFAIAVCICQKK